MAEQRAIQIVPVERPGLDRTFRLFREKRVALFAGRLGLRRRHLQPANRPLAGIAPGVERADFECAEISRTETPAALATLSTASPSRMQKPFSSRSEGAARSRPAGPKLVQTQAGVHRAGGVYQPASLRVTPAVVFKDGGAVNARSAIFRGNAWGGQGGSQQH